MKQKPMKKQWGCKPKNAYANTQRFIEIEGITFVMYIIMYSNVNNLCHWY